MIPKDLYSEIEEMTSRLLEMVAKSCWNKVSDKCLYIFSTEYELQVSKPLLFNKMRKRKNDKKRPKELSEIIQDLENRYDDLYEINLYVFKAEKSRTIIEIRSSLASEYAAQGWPCVPFTEPMLHSKLHLPPYQKEGEKFDLNWTLGGLRHEWNMTMWRYRKKRIFN